MSCLNSKNQDYIPLSLCYVNAQSLGSLNHLYTIKTLLFKKCIDVLLVTETWLNKSYDEHYANIDGYNMVRRDRNGKGGGEVCIYLRNTLKYNIICSSNENFDNKPEYIFLELLIKNVKLLCSVVYRRPKGESILLYIMKLAELIPRYENVVCCGDINIDMNKNSNPKKRFLTELNDIGMSPLPIENTHITASSATTIDVILCRDNVDIKNYGKISLPDLSAHQLLYVMYPILIPKNTIKMITVRDYGKVQVEAMLNDALNGKWTNIIPYININNKVEVLNSELLTVWNRHAPLRNIRLDSSRAPWITKHVIDTISKRNAARRNWTKKKV
jgi:hypothetical protein